MSVRSLALKAFQPARPSSTARVLLRTGAQTAVFWIVFLAVIPWAICQLERRLEIPSFSFPLQPVVAWTLFALGGALGLTSGAVMSIHGRGTPLPTECPRTLVVRGPYRHVRNPMAVAGIAQGVAVGLALGSPMTIAYALTGAVLWHVVVRPIEETDLTRRFGADYLAYRKRVRCWIPRRSLARDREAPPPGRGP
ncbi:MAG: methyltransferase family protein [Planctomycetota bacterium]|jgi:protein-S-isoprenylcysteine O-methyltransferase Ste14